MYEKQFISILSVSLLPIILLSTSCSRVPVTQSLLDEFDIDTLSLKNVQAYFHCKFKSDDGSTKRHPVVFKNIIKNNKKSVSIGKGYGEKSVLSKQTYRATNFVTLKHKTPGQIIKSYIDTTGDLFLDVDFGNNIILTFSATDEDSKFWINDEELFYKNKVYKNVRGDGYLVLKAKKVTKDRKKLNKFRIAGKRI